MKWFYNLKNKYRVLIAVGAWLPMFIMGAILGGNTDNMPTWQSLLSVLFLAVGIFFTIFAVKAYNAQKPKKEKVKQQPTPRRTGRTLIAKNPDGSLDVRFADGTFKHYTADEAKDIEIIEDVPDEDIDDDTSSDNEDVDDNVSIKTSFTHNFIDVELPMFTKLVGVTFDNRQDNIKNSQIGDDLLITHKPTSEYPEATIAINTRTNQILGSIKKDLANMLVLEFGNNFVLIGKIADITNGKDNKFGCNIQIINKQ